MKIKMRCQRGKWYVAVNSEVTIFENAHDAWAHVARLHEGN